MEHVPASKMRYVKVAIIATLLIVSVVFFAAQFTKSSKKSKASDSCNAGLTCTNDTMCGTGGHCALGIDGVPEIGKCLCAQQDQTTALGLPATSGGGASSGEFIAQGVTIDSAPLLCPSYMMVEPPEGCLYEPDPYAGVTPNGCAPAPLLTCKDDRDCSRDNICGYGKSCVQSSACMFSDSQNQQIGAPCEISFSCKSDDIQISNQILWWFDDKNHICQEKTFFGTYMYPGLQTYKTKEDCIYNLRLKYDIVCAAYDIGIPPKGCDYRITNGVDGKGCQLPPTLECKEGRICQEDGICGKNQECFQPPMPICSGDLGCAQVMPQKICQSRDIVCPMRPFQIPPLGCQYVTRQTFLPTDCPESDLVCDIGRICTKDQTCGVGKICTGITKNISCGPGELCVNSATAIVQQGISEVEVVAEPGPIGLVPERPGIDPWPRPMPPVQAEMTCQYEHICPMYSMMPAPIGCSYVTAEKTVPGDCSFPQLICDIGRNCTEDLICGFNQVCKSDCPAGAQCFRFNATCQSGEPEICPAKPLAPPPPFCEWVPKEPTRDNPCPDYELKCEETCGGVKCAAGEICTYPDMPKCNEEIACPMVMPVPFCKKDQIADADGDGKICLTDYTWIQSAFNGLYDNEKDAWKKKKADFNMNGSVDDGDMSLFKKQYDPAKCGQTFNTDGAG